MTGGDGSSVTLAVGEPDYDFSKGKVYIYTISLPAMTVSKPVEITGDSSFGYFGHSVAVSGDVVVVGAYGECDDSSCSQDHGVVYAIKKDGKLLSKMFPDSKVRHDAFGTSVDILRSRRETLLFLNRVSRPARGKTSRSSAGRWRPPSCP
jgi:hypothetical protein